MAMNKTENSNFFAIIFGKEMIHVTGKVLRKFVKPSARKGVGYLLN